MKREIKFRGLRVDGKGWAYGDLVINKPTQSYRIIRNFALCQNAKYTEDKLHHISGEIYLVHPETVGQFTGLTDKNGKEIFEGDLIFWQYMGDQKYEVYYNTDETVFVGRPLDKYDETECWMDNRCEVIGNIH